MSQSDETLRGLLGLSLDDDLAAIDADADDDPNWDDSNNPAMHAIKAVSNMLRIAERNNQYIDDYFTHDHYLYACDGNGAYYIISLFTMVAVRPGAPRLSMVTTAVIRCHDNFRDSIFLPTQAQHSGPFFQQFLEDRRNDAGMDFRRVSYNLCAKLITECLLRMKRSNKILQGKEAKTVARLFGLSTRDAFHQVVPKLPEPMPAPNVESLWITLCRPTYYFFTFNEDLCSFFHFDSGSRVMDETKFKQAMRYITTDKYRRNRMYAMLEHMAWFHTVASETEVASWLLWERASMLTFTDKKSAIEAMESNIIFQLMINRFFKPGTGLILSPQFPGLGEYGKGLTNYFLYQTDLHNRGTLPPNFIYSASIADIPTNTLANNDTAAAASAVSNTTTAANNNTDSAGIRKLTKYVDVKKGKCAICGATTNTDTAGGRLQECARCHSVVYCCKEHQVLHWKKGGHKQECMPK